MIVSKVEPQGNRKGCGAGFMLIELMVVVMIIGILVLMAFRFFGDVPADAKIAKATMELKEIADACQEFCSRNGTYPKEFSELAAAGFISGPITTPYGTTYSIDGNYVFCPFSSAGSGPAGGKAEGLSRLYNPVLLYDEFDDEAKSRTVWTSSSSFTNLDFVGAVGNENVPGTFVKANSTVLTSIASLPAADYKLRAVIPSREYNTASKTWIRKAGSVEFSVGSKVTMRWNNATGYAYAKIGTGSQQFDNHLAPDMNVHELRAKVIHSKSKPNESLVIYYVDNRCFAPNGEIVTGFTGGPIVVTLSKGTYIGNVEVSFVE